MFPGSFLLVFLLVPAAFMGPEVLRWLDTYIYGVVSKYADYRDSNVQEQVWTWVNEGDEYFYDKLEWVRIRVEDEHWHDLTPVAPSERGSESAAERKSPYSITVSRWFSCVRQVLTLLGFDDAIRTWTCRMVVAMKTSFRFRGQPFVVCNDSVRHLTQMQAMERRNVRYNTSLHH